MRQCQLDTELYMMRAKSPFSPAASMPTAVGQMEELGTRAAVVVVEACELHVLSLSRHLPCPRALLETVDNGGAGDRVLGAAVVVVARLTETASVVVMTEVVGPQETVV